MADLDTLHATSFSPLLCPALPLEQVPKPEPEEFALPPIAPGITWPHAFSHAHQVVAEKLRALLKPYTHKIAPTSWTLDVQEHVASSGTVGAELTLRLVVGHGSNSSSPADTGTKRTRETAAAAAAATADARPVKKQERDKPPVSHKRRASKKAQEAAAAVKEKETPSPAPCPAPTVAATPALTIDPCMMLDCGAPQTRTLGFCRHHRDELLFHDDPAARSELYELLRFLQLMDEEKGNFVLWNGTATDALVYRGLAPNTSTADVAISLLTFTTSEYAARLNSRGFRFNKSTCVLTKDVGIPKASVQIFTLTDKLDKQPTHLAQFKVQVAETAVHALTRKLNDLRLKGPVPVGSFLPAPASCDGCALLTPPLPTPLLAANTTHLAAFLQTVLHTKMPEANVTVTRVQDYVAYYALAAKFYEPGKEVPGLLFSIDMANPQFALLLLKNSKNAIAALAVISLVYDSPTCTALHIYFLAGCPTAPTAKAHLLAILEQLQAHIHFHKIQTDTRDLVTFAAYARMGYTFAESHIPCAERREKHFTNFLECTWRPTHRLVPLQQSRGEGFSKNMATLITADAEFIAAPCLNTARALVAIKYVLSMRLLEFYYPPEQHTFSRMFALLQNKPLFYQSTMEADVWNLLKAFAGDASGIFAGVIPDMAKALGFALQATSRHMASLRSFHTSVVHIIKTQNKEKAIQQLEQWIRIALDMPTLGETPRWLDAPVQMDCPLLPAVEGDVPA